MFPCKFAFAISKCKKDWDLDPCINLELANECRCTVATFDKFGGKLATHFLIRSRNHAASCQREPLLRGNINQESWYWPLLRWGDGRWGKKKFWLIEKFLTFWYPIQGPGRMASAPQAGTGNSMSRFRRYHCSTLIKYNSYFLVGEQSCFQLLLTT